MAASPRAEAAMTLAGWRRSIVIVALLAALVTTLALLLWLSLSERSSRTEVIFLDVGQGDSVLIKTKYGHNILIDGGRDMRVLDRLGRNVSFFDRTLDLVIATHPDSDHIAGLVPVLERYRVGLLLESGVVHDSSVFEAFHRTVAERHIPTRVVASRQVYSFGAGVVLDVLFPNRSFAGAVIPDNNAASIVVKFTDGEIDYLLTGDAPDEVEDALVAEYGAHLDAEVLKAGHHGSQTSSSELFLDTVTPEIMVIQVGKDNPYGHPNYRVLKRFSARRIPVFRNDELGDIKLVSDGEFVELR